ncbi:MAG TPA: PIN domain-containing protein [Oligoflexia bacterium]|nr:PIN domain-containing protein [Oligoflexia bacterium]HMP48228.1 PIN domain-containing protein [Oligoflexia bacterium]
MKGKFILVDTSYWIDALRKNGNKQKKEKFQSLLISGVVAWSDPIKLELWNGTRNPHEIKILEEFSSVIKNYEVTSEVWQYSLKIGSYLRRKGLTIPCVDILIAATASYYEVELLHDDKHFDNLLKLIN